MKINSILLISLLVSSVSSANIQSLTDDGFRAFVSDELLYSAKRRDDLTNSISDMKAAREIQNEWIIENRDGVNQLIRHRNATKEFNTKEVWFALLDTIRQMKDQIATLENKIEEFDGLLNGGADRSNEANCRDEGDRNYAGEVQYVCDTGK